MKFKKSIKLFGIILLVSILFRGFIYRTLIKYRKIGVRESIEVTNKDLITEINNRIENRKLNLEEIAIISQEITKEKLDFTFRKISHNPNIVYNLGEANCMGYASLCNSISNFIIKKQHQENKYIATNIYGELEIFGYSINRIFKRKFFKEHDYNEIREYRTNKSIFTDSSIGDYLQINIVSAK